MSPDEEFRVHLEALNGLHHELSQWQGTSATKDHVDEFGDTINSGDNYYSRPLGGSVSAVLKLSRRSMETLLDCLFSTNGPLLQYGHQVKNQRFEQLRELVENRDPNSPSG